MRLAFSNTQTLKVLWTFCSLLWTTPTERFSLQLCNRLAILRINIGGVPGLSTLTHTGTSALSTGASLGRNGKRTGLRPDNNASRKLTRSLLESKRFP